MWWYWSWKWVMLSFALYSTTTRWLMGHFIHYAVSNFKTELTSYMMGHSWLSIYSFSLLLQAFVIVSCNRSITTMIAKESNLTWFNEWVIYFQWIWGSATLNLKTMAIMEQVAELLKLCLTKSWKWVWMWCNNGHGLWVLRRILCYGCNNGKTSMDRNELYSGMILMLMFLILLMQIQIKPALILLWKLCCKWCCLPTVVQLDGRLGTLVWLNIWFRLRYQQQAGIFTCLQDFAKECATDCHFPFLNIMDKANHCIMYAQHASHQLLLQPDFARNRWFNLPEVLRSGAIALQWSSNEWPVNVMKHSGLICHGLCSMCHAKDRQ